jgi:outer membrane protein TolC
VKVVLPLFVVLTAALGVSAPAAAQGQPAPGSGAPGREALSPSSPFLGSVPSGTATAETISLSVGEAIARALEHNLGLLMAEHSTQQAEGARRQALSDLLPNVSGRVAQTRQLVNLAAFGFPLPAGFPSIVGPFNVFDARVYLSQSIFDAKARNDLKAERHNVAAADYSYKSARDLVVLVTANAYLQALAAAARADSALAQMRTAEALFNQATDLKTAGLVAGIDVLRAQLQFSTTRQRNTAAQNDAQKVKLQLARVVGLPNGQEFSLVEELPNIPSPDLTLEQAFDRALKARPDYQAALERVQAAEASRQAALGESLPSVHVTADFGDLGLSPADSHGTYAVTGAVTVPIFEGGKRKGRLLAADATLRSRRAEADDMKSAVYYEVRSAFLDLRATEEQLQVASQARDLAAQQLTQARDRLAAGVANNLEVVQAQEAVSLASEQYIGALYGFNIAKAVLARGLGVAEEAARQYIGGIR